MNQQNNPSTRPKNSSINSTTPPSGVGGFTPPSGAGGLIPDIDLVNISRFRGEHMGAAMLMIILFHVALPRSDAFFGLRRVGNLGVDIFLFLSGIGLWFSWAKQKALVEKETVGRFFNDWWQFYKRRLIRIYPAWLLMASLYYIPRYHHGWDLWAGGHGLIDLLGDILINWDFWLHDELTFWYIPAIMMLYLFAPPFMELIRRHPIYRWLVLVMVMWTVLVQWVTPIHHAVGHLEIFWSRVPIFFLGISMGEMVRRKDTLDGASIWMMWIMFLMSLLTSIFLEQNLHGRFPLFIERLLYIPLVVTTVILFNRMWRRTPRWFNAIFAWVGMVSLEGYLIHIHFVLCYVEKYHLGYWPTFLITIAITLPLAYLLHIAMTQVSRLLTKYC